MSNLPDADLIEFVTKMYGPAMGCKVEDLFADDPDNETGFANSVRRSLTHEKGAMKVEAQIAADDREHEERRKAGEWPYGTSMAQPLAETPDSPGDPSGQEASQKQLRSSSEMS